MVTFNLLAPIFILLLLTDFGSIFAMKSEPLYTGV
jgi:hypothetical protein